MKLTREEKEYIIPIISFILIVIIIFTSLIITFQRKTVEVDLLYNDGTTETVRCIIYKLNDKPYLHRDKPCLNTIDGVRCDIKKMTNVRNIEP